MRVLARDIGHRLAGTPVCCATPDRNEAVVWVDAGDEVVVHRRSVRARIERGALLLTVELESEETGRRALTVPFALAGSTAIAGSVYGNPHLVARWGHILQNALWSALVGVAGPSGAFVLNAKLGVLRIDARP
jgi:hypothetical protein